MSNRAVLAIGVDPACLDAAQLGGFSPDVVRAYLEAEVDRLRTLDIEAETCLVDLGETAEAKVESALRSRSYACIVIGAGLREPADRVPLLERVINLVRTLAPHTPVAFNTSPADTAEAARRWLTAPGEAG